MLFCTPLRGKCTDEEFLTRLDDKEKEEGLHGVLVSVLHKQCWRDAGEKEKSAGSKALTSGVYSIIHSEVLSKTLKSVLDTGY